MKKLILLLTLLFCISSIEANTTRPDTTATQISRSDSITSYDATLIFPVQKKVSGLYRWRKIMFPDLIKIVTDSITASAINVNVDSAAFAAAQDSILAHLTSNGNVSFVQSPPAPTERADSSPLLIGDVWYNNADTTNVLVYRWNGSNWISVSNFSVNWNYLNNTPSFLKTPSGTGLFMTPTYIGFYTGGAWKTYIDNTGKFYFVGNSTNQISWNGSALSVIGSINIQNPTTAFNGGKLDVSQLTNSLGWGAAGAVDSSGIHSFSQSTAPDSSHTGDLWYDTVHKVLKRTNGTNWGIVGANGTYIDASGLYTSTIAAQNIVAGTGIINTLIVGSNSLAGGIQSYDYSAGSAGWKIAKGTAEFNGATIRVANGLMAGMTINANSLYTGSKTAYDDNKAGVHIGTDGIGMGSVFSVGSNGYLVAQNAIITGTIHATGGDFISGVTVGTLANTGYVKSYNYVANTTGWKIDNSTAEFNGATITGGTIQTATSGQRVVIGSNQISLYDASGLTGTLFGNLGTIYMFGMTQGASTSISTTTQHHSYYGTYNGTNHSASQYGLVGTMRSGTVGTGIYGNMYGVTGSAQGGDIAYGVYGTAFSASVNWAGYFDAGNVYVKNQLEVGSSKYIVNSSGQLTTVNNIAASGHAGYILQSDGTSYTSTAGLVWKGELSSDPSSPSSGWMYFNYATSHVKIYTSGGWRNLD